MYKFKVLFIQKLQTLILGYHCEIEANNCSLPDNACQNGGDCIFDNQTLIEHCQCVPGYTGKFCSDNIDDCASLPCHHGGSCIDKINGFDCACPFGKNAY